MQQVGAHGQNEFKVPVYQRSTGQQLNGAQQPRSSAPPQTGGQIRDINFELADLYFPLFVIQCRYDVFPLRNRQYRKNDILHNGGDFANQQDQQRDHDLDDDLFAYQEYMITQFESQCKIFFILRDFYLLTKIQLTGTIVFHVKKDDKHFFGLDDSTGVMTCVLWLNDYGNQGGPPGKRQSEIRSWLSTQNVSIGDTLAVLGALEYYQDKIQINVHKLRLIRDSGEEMLQYQQALMAQKVYFDPTKPFERRLLKNKTQQKTVNTLQQPDYVTAGQKQNSLAETVQAEGLIQHTIKRVKKKINDFILSNYNRLFFKNSAKTTPQQDARAAQEPAENGAGASNQTEQTLSIESILTNNELIAKAEAELRLCEDRNKAPRELLQECVNELEERGFLNLLEQGADQYMYQIRDQRDKLRHFITKELKDSARGLSFDTIHKRVSTAFSNFFTKDFVFKVIDELFQMGLIYEVSRCTYMYLDNNFA